MIDLSFNEALELARKRHGESIGQTMQDLADGLTELTRATSVSVAEIVIPHTPYTHGEAEALASWIIDCEERKRPLARLRRWLRKRGFLDG